MTIARFVALVVTIRIGSNDGDDGEDNNCDLENDKCYFIGFKINNSIRKKLVIASYYLHVES